ncbi:lipopolysaccharide biosynthesis protein [Winogradskyella ludwigii]|uniref:lipopolysaccharide biosynthesis protein n=1 Tax=Winogradskyella ludwigii TaxID=2686076 RepID=UPI0015CA0E99|nr:polysaccharide biosynthesis protein [Winogradskyella ludwigii]
MNNSIKHWVKLISITASAQVIVQALGFVCGILIIRLLPIEEYALYILANTMLGTMTVLGNAGIDQGVMSEGGKVWQDKNKLGAVLITGLNLRRKFAICSLMLTTPILLYLLIGNGASWLTSIMISLSLIPSFYASLSDGLLQVVPKLNQNIKSLQKNQVTVSIGRITLLFLTLFVFPFAVITILANGAPRVYGNIKLRKIAKEHANLEQVQDPEVQKNILKIVKRILPGSIYYAISGQLVIWLVSIFGDTESIAKLGALSRLTMLITFVVIMIDYVLVPRFSKLKNNRHVLIKEYFTIQVVLLVVSFIILCGTFVFSDYILFVLGDNYVGLNNELFLMAVNGCVLLFSISTNKLMSSRGIVLSPVFFIIFMIIIQFTFVFLVDLKSLDGIIIYSILTTIPIYLIRIIYFLIQIRKS